MEVPARASGPQQQVKAESFDLDRLKRGDAPAWGWLVDGEWNHAYYLALQITGAHEIAEDAVQSAFLRAYRHINTFRPETGSFRAWFYRIVYNEACRQRKREARVATAGLEDCEAQARDDADLADTGELQDRLVGHLHALSEHDQSLILYCCIEAMPRRDVAKIMGTSEGSIRTGLHRALARLRERFERDGK